MSNSITETKTCTKCNKTNPATLEFFGRDKTRQDGLYPQCRVCVRERNQLYRENNPDKDRERHRVYRESNKDKVSQYRKARYAENVENERLYRENNREKSGEYNKEYYLANREQLLENVRQYRIANRDKITAYQRNNPLLAAVSRQRRRARKLSLPDTLTKAQWQACLEYFNYSCAVCGQSFDGAKVHQDHWIPLSSEKCLGTTVDNIVCLCSDCNLSKHNRVPQEWLEWKFGVVISEQTLARIENYFREVR